MEECSYCVGNILVQVRYIFLPNYPLILSLLKLRSVGVFWNKKKSSPNRGNPLNSRIENNKKHQGKQESRRRMWIMEGSTSPPHRTYSVVLFYLPLG